MMPAIRTMPKAETLSSVDLLVKAQSGDGDALNELLTRYMPRLRRYAKRHLPWGLRTMLDTDDLVQEAVVKALPHVATFEIRSERAFELYLRTLLKHRIIDLKRRTGRRPARHEMPEDIPAARQSIRSELIEAESLDQYKRALATLKKEDQQAIRLRLEEQLEFAEIAQRLGKRSADAARMAVTRSIVRLAAKMKAESSQRSSRRTGRRGAIRRPARVNHEKSEVDIANYAG
jgi:RNA polymerase sigma-70 factor (ECF subfamily)